MLKALCDAPGGRKIFLIGLSFGNLDKFRAEPGDSYIRIDGKEHGLSCDIMIFSGNSEAHLAQIIGEFVGPETKVHISDKLKQ